MENTLSILELARIPAEERDAVARLHNAFSALQPPITRALRDLSNSLGSSYATVLRRYYLWRERGLAGLVNGARHPDFGPARGGNVSPETREYFRKLCLENGRKMAPAWKKLMRQFYAGEVIPGLPPGTDREALPAGWTKSNFYQYAPTPFELRAARQGLQSAADFRPLVFTTRVGLEVGQFYMFDDMWHDFEVVVLGSRERCRLLQLHAHDLFSACQFARGIKPRVRKDDGTSTGLTEHEMLFLLANVLQNFGHHPLGTTLLLEAGTATVREKLAELLRKLSGGKVICHVGEVQNAAAFAGQYLGRGKGNFRLKASLESSHNLIHNETADMITFPGQTGSNSRTNLPEELHGRQKAQDQLLQAMAALPSRVALKLRNSFLEVTEAIWAVEEIMERINRRTEHDIEGFVEAGLTTLEYVLPGGGKLTEQDVILMPDDKRAALQTLAETRARKCSPREVFDAGARSLIKWRPEQIAMLLYAARRANPVKVGKDHLVTFEDRGISPEPLRFKAHHFPPGEQFDAVVNPVNPDDGLYIYDARGRWVGQLEHWGRVARVDVDQLERRMGAAEKVRNELLQPLRVRGAELARRRLADLEDNNATLTTARTADLDSDDETDAALREALR